MMRKMICGYALSFIFLCACLGQATLPDERGYIVKVGDKIENCEIGLLEGSVRKLSQFHAKVIVLNFFASW